MEREQKWKKSRLDRGSQPFLVVARFRLFIPLYSKSISRSFFVIAAWRWEISIFNSGSTDERAQTLITTLKHVKTIKSLRQQIIHSSETRLDQI